MTTPSIPYRLDGKVALVTGSGRGIGAAIAVELGRLGAEVVVNYANSATSADKVVAEIKELGSDAAAFKADVRQVPQIVKLMDDATAHFGGLDVVCSNSGVVSFGHLGDVTEVCLFVLVLPFDEPLTAFITYRKSSTVSSVSTRGASSSWPGRLTATLMRADASS